MAKKGTNQPGQGTPNQTTGGGTGKPDEFTEALEKMKRALDKRTGVLTGYNALMALIGVATLVTTLVYSRRTAEQTQRSVDAQVKSVEAQVKSLDLQVKTMDLQYRPWLAVKAFDPPKFDGKPNDEFKWSVTNGGPVPAEGTWTTNIFILDHEPKSAELFPAGQPIIRRFALGAAQEITFQNFAKEIKDAPTFPTAMSGAMGLYACILLDFVGVDRNKDTYKHRQCVRYDAEHKVWNLFTPE